MGEIDELICLGDSIYEYRFSNEVVRLLKDREAQVILATTRSISSGRRRRARARDGSTRSSPIGSPIGRTGTS